MPNQFAYFALIIWPIISIAIFSRRPPSQALIVSLVAGYLLLPMNTEINLPGVPAYDKTSAANISALTGALIFARGPVIRPPREWWWILLMLIYIFSPLGTIWTNRDPLIVGDTALPALSLYDALSAAAYKIIDLIPFLLGYNLLKGPKGHHKILRVLTTSALIYTILMLIEVRLSPQIHVWIYGFFPHSFGQQIRDGGFRPVVFLGHGLVVAIFTAMAVVAGAYLAKTHSKIFGMPALSLTIYLFAVLLLCRSFGALALTLWAIPMMVALREKSLSRVCAIVAISVLSYPALRGADIVPVQWVADNVAGYSAERSGSFQFRIDNEEALLIKARQRPLFGWGGYGRNRVYEESTGRDTSITDGTWIIIVGVYGWVGYLAAFGLLGLPMITNWIRRGNLEPPTAALSLVLAINLVDLLPNSSLSPLTWLIAGSLTHTVGRQPSSSKSRDRLRPQFEPDPSLSRVVPAGSLTRVQLVKCALERPPK